MFAETSGVSVCAAVSGLTQLVERPRGFWLPNSLGSPRTNDGSFFEVQNGN